ncbi:MAG TPA: glycosyltransferase family 4 protein, partial [Anaerolineaceae bacterium]|nr:glycosyltransferase family 4 protein [Anaerolineaceae bacterium]
MRILVLCHEYPPLGGGGGRVAQDLSRGFVQQGHQVKLITPWFKDLPGTENDQGVEIIRIKSSRSQLFRADLKAMLGFVWASFWKGLQTARQWKPDVIHIHFAVPGGAAGYAISLLIGIPYVLTAHLGDVPGGVPEKTGKWFRWIFPFTP